jgi:hypothetical protein
MNLKLALATILASSKLTCLIRAQIRAIALHFLDIIMCLTLCLSSHYKHFEGVPNLNMNGFVWCTLIGYLIILTHHFWFKKNFRIRELADAGIWDNITTKEALVLGI